MAMNLDQTVDSITPSSGGLIVGGLILNPTTVSVNYTSPANYNILSVGPITINTGITVTIDTTGTWVVV